MFLCSGIMNMVVSIMILDGADLRAGLRWAGFEVEGSVTQEDFTAGLAMEAEAAATEVAEDIGKIQESL
jgi:hypothetical protein